MDWTLIFLTSVLIIGCLIWVVVLHDVLTYMDLMRWLREERERRAEKWARELSMMLRSRTSLPSRP